MPALIHLERRGHTPQVPGSHLDPCAEWGSPAASDVAGLLCSPGEGQDSRDPVLEPHMLPLLKEPMAPLQDNTVLPTGLVAALSLGMAPL